MTFIKQLLGQRFPELANDLVIAKIDEDPEIYLKKKLLAALYMAAGMGVLTFMIVDKMGYSYLWVIVSFVVWFYIDILP